MGLFTRWFTRPEEARSTLANPEPWLLAALGAEPTAAGVSLSPESAAALPDVYSCCQVIAEDLARTPLKLQAVSDGNRIDATDHALWEILHDLANPETTSFELRYDMTWDLLLHERAYAQVIRSSAGSVIALWRLDPVWMTVDRAPDGRKRYTYRPNGNGQPLVFLFDADRPPILELRKRSPIRRVRETLGLASAIDVYGAKFFANGARLSGMFTAANAAPGTPGEKTLTEKLRALFSSSQNSHKFLVTNGDVKYTPFTSKNDEAQFNETRELIAEVICGCFRMPPHKISRLKRATNNNIEHQDIEYFKDTLGPHYTIWSQALRRDVLTTRQYPRYDVLFDEQSMIRGDFNATMDALTKGVNAAIFTIDDALRRLGMNTIGGEIGKMRMVNGNMLSVKAVQQTETTPADPAPEPPAPARVI